MTEPAASKQRSPATRHAATLIAWLCVALGVAVLAGWAFGVPGLTRVLPGLDAMKANTALSFILCGAALAIRAQLPDVPAAKWTARALIIPPVFIAVLTLIEHVSGHSLGLDGLLLGAAQRAGGSDFPGRMTPGSATCFLFLGVIIAGLEYDLADLLAVLPAAIGVVGIAGNLDALRWSTRLISYSTMALNTAAGITLLTGGVMLARADRGFMTLVRERTAIGSLTRLLLLGSFVVPLTIGWALYDLEHQQMITQSAYAGLSIVMTIIGLTLFAQLLSIQIKRAESARASADKAREEAYVAFRDLFDSVPVGLFRSLPDGTILDGNPALVEILGLPNRAALLAHNARDFYADPAERDRFVQALVTSGTVVGMEMRFRRPDGTVRWVQDHAYLVRRPDGSISHMAGSFIDITERKQTEAQFLAAQRMEAVGRLAGGIAHDFNNLLTVAQATAEFLLEDTPPDDRRRADVEEILGTVKRATVLTRQLLAFSRHQVFETHVLNLNDVVHGMDSLLRRVIGEDVELVTDRAADLGNTRADPAQVEQVIANLAVNARDAMPEGGRLTIRTANVTLDQAYADDNLGVTPGEYVSLDVSDTGQGIPEEVAAHIFEPFFTTKGPGKGTGLGLATVYGIVHQSGGHVKLHSEVGFGTTFKVYLPRVEEALESGRDSAPGVEQPRRAEAGETILVVDDDASVRSATVRILKSLGYTPSEVTDPVRWREAVETHEGTIHLLLTDVVMSGISGPTLAAQFHALRPEARILFASGYADIAARTGERLPADAAFIQKPFTLEGLSHKVYEVLHGTG